MFYGAEFKYCVQIAWTVSENDIRIGLSKNEKSQ